jgi:hypothetical protein
MAEQVLATFRGGAQVEVIEDDVELIGLRVYLAGVTRLESALVAG